MAAGLVRKYEDMLREYPRLGPGDFVSDPPLYRREAAHPRLVNHIFGLNDERICKVRGLSRQNTFQQNSYRTGPPVVSTVVTTDTFTGIPRIFKLRDISRRLKAIPGEGMAPVEENWRRELRALTEAISKPIKETLQELSPRIPLGPHYSYPILRAVTPAYKPRLYSGNPYLAYLKEIENMYRISSKSERPFSPTKLRVPKFKLIEPIEATSGDQEQQVIPECLEEEVFGILCQILCVQQPETVQKWLTTASDNEKMQAFDLIQKAITEKYGEESQNSSMLNKSIHERSISKTNESKATTENLTVGDNDFAEQTEEHSANFDRLTLQSRIQTMLPVLYPRSKSSISSIRPRTQSTFGPSSSKTVSCIYKMPPDGNPDSFENSVY